jgi:hypothetical protein
MHSAIEPIAANNIATQTGDADWQRGRCAAMQVDLHRPDALQFGNTWRGFDPC